MPTSAAVPRSPFVPRTAQLPYSHLKNYTCAELDRLRLIALRAMVEVEPYGSSDLGSDPSDDEPPSLSSASPSDDDDPEERENPSDKTPMILQAKTSLYSKSTQKAIFRTATAFVLDTAPPK